MEKFEPGDIVYSLSAKRGPDDMTWTVIGYIGDTCYICANPHHNYPNIQKKIDKAAEERVKNHPAVQEVIEAWAVADWRGLLRLKVGFVQLVRDAIATSGESTNGKV